MSVQSAPNAGIAAIDGSIEGRARELFREQETQNHAQTDRLFAGLLFAEWLAGIVAAIWISPRTWLGAQSATHVHVWAAILLGGLITGVPIVLALRLPGATITRHTIATAQMLTSGLLIHLSGGRIESHFHVFGSLAFLAFYRDWKVFIPATLVVAADHFLRGVYWPQSVFGVLAPASWRWAEHAAWVVFENVFLVRSCLRSVREMSTLAHRQSELEHVQAATEAIVEQRTHDLAEVKRYQELILCSLGEGILGIDLEGRITLANPRACELLGRHRADLLGDDAFAYMGTEVNDAHGPRDILRSGLVLSERETEIRRSDDTRLPVALHGTPIREDDRLLGAVIVFRDTTEERELHRQLLQAQKLESIGQLAAGIAHEINTPTQYVGDNVRFLRESFSQLLDPLRGIQSAIEGDEALQSVPALAAIRRSLAESDVDYLREEVPRSLEQCVDGIDRISTIVRAMKQFSHPGQERSLADINRAIESTVTVASNEWKYVAEVVMDLDPNLPRLECMLGELNQVVLNLVVNAAQAIAERSAETEGTRGTIRITTRAVDGSIEIAISDDGTGISEELLERVFDPFFTTKPVGSGTGQGLAIAHSVVCRKHGGKLNVASEVGKGSTFTILLPLEPATEPAAS